MFQEFKEEMKILLGTKEGLLSVFVMIVGVVMAFVLMILDRYYEIGMVYFILCPLVTLVGCEQYIKVLSYIREEKKHTGK